MASAKTWYGLELDDAVLNSRYPWAAFVANVNSHGHGSTDAKAVATRVVLDADRPVFYTTDRKSYDALADIRGLNPLGEVASPYGAGGDDDDDDEPAEPGEGE